MEGVLMRSPNFWGMAVRAPSGDVEIQAEPFRSVTRKSKLFRLPVIRGFLSLAETLWLGMKALTLSTNIALGEDEDLSKKEIAITLIFGLGLAFLLFLAAPVLGTKGLGALFGNSIENPILFNLVEGALRIGIFMLYLVGITAVSKDIKRFFAYHGAEHKAIKVYERGEELVPANARKLDTSHVRCGTSFILYVLVLSILEREEPGQPSGEGPDLAGLATAEADHPRAHRRHGGGRDGLAEEGPPHGGRGKDSPQRGDKQAGYLREWGVGSRE
jgi:uncharacterized protein YqhQ